MSSGTGRPILAPRTSSGDTNQSGGSASGLGGGHAPGFGGKAKRTLIESACAACRRRKSKCDGVRPTCSRCQSLRTDCVYEAEEGESRWAALRRRAMSVEAERDDLLEILTLMRSLHEPEALEIFHRLRNSSLEDLITGLRQSRDSSTSQAQQPQSPYGASSMNEQRLPPIRSIFDVSGSTQAQVGPGMFQTTARPGMPSLPSEGSTESYGSIQSGPYEHFPSRHPSDQDPG